MRTHLATLLAFTIVTGCAVGSGVVVKGAGPDDLLKLREGPGLNHKIIIGLPDGTRLTRQNCVTNNGKVWCRVSLTDRPAISGYVSADYLAHR
ncbi:SH3 domain-containing protein [Paracoccus halophilus]|uniref:Peptide-binding protein n=1 Tax=Paracoccus halophilus TaxID=376733 RepID=A0A099EW96_9RHOB|nr:SH3 domain-containing protein [Paracoccus halophilus]KGJ02242.1 peptide-binding protein [Paracoccus halophilus]SFA61697.1 SH3 domain-containing protein [Paracoccus halophilus]